MILQASIARVVSSIHEAVLRSTVAPTYEEIQEYDAQIVSAVNSLPAYLRSGTDGAYHFAHCIHTWSTRDFRASLFRPFLLAAAWDARDGAEERRTQEEQDAIE